MNKDTKKKFLICGGLLAIIALTIVASLIIGVLVKIAALAICAALMCGLVTLYIYNNKTDYSKSNENPNSLNNDNSQPSSSPNQLLKISELSNANLKEVKDL